VQSVPISGPVMHRVGRRERHRAGLGHCRRHRDRRAAICHEGEVRPLAFRADGLRDVLGAWDGTAWVLDAASGMAAGEPLLGHEECLD
jgi:hypothetical protein